MTTATDSTGILQSIQGDLKGIDLRILPKDARQPIKDARESVKVALKTIKAK